MKKYINLYLCAMLHGPHYDSALIDIDIGHFLIIVIVWQLQFHSFESKWAPLLVPILLMNGF